MGLSAHSQCEDRERADEHDLSMNRCTYIVPTGSAASSSSPSSMLGSSSGTSAMSVAWTSLDFVSTLGTPGATMVGLLALLALMAGEATVGAVGCVDGVSDFLALSLFFLSKRAFLSSPGGAIGKVLMMNDDGQ